MTSGQTGRGAISFKLPAVAKRTTYTLQMRLISEIALAYGEDRDIEVWPDAPVQVGALARNWRCMIQGQHGQGVHVGGRRVRGRQDARAPAGEASAWTFVIGEGALDRTNAQQVEAMAALGKFVENGGRIVVLAQSALPEGLPATTEMEPREWVSQPFVRLPIHPVLDGVTSWDLHFWRTIAYPRAGHTQSPTAGGNSAGR